jgi:hypothetical protein
MNNRSNLFTGIFIGVGLSFTAYYVYNKNKDKVNEFLRNQGINIPESTSKDFASMSLEELVGTKEHIEDLIAEIEHKNEQEKKAKSKKA